jgi:hypothetical protein
MRHRLEKPKGFMRYLLLYPGQWWHFTSNLGEIYHDIRSWRQCRIRQLWRWFMVRLKDSYDRMRSTVPILHIPNSASPKEIWSILYIIWQLCLSSRSLPIEKLKWNMPFRDLTGHRFDSIPEEPSQKLCIIVFSSVLLVSKRRTRLMSWTLCRIDDS